MKKKKDRKEKENTGLGSNYPTTNIHIFLEKGFVKVKRIFCKTIYK